MKCTFVQAVFNKSHEQEAGKLSKQPNSSSALPCRMLELHSKVKLAQ